MTARDMLELRALNARAELLMFADMSIEQIVLYMHLQQQKAPATWCNPLTHRDPP